MTSITATQPNPANKARTADLADFPFALPDLTTDASALLFPFDQLLLQRASHQQQPQRPVIPEDPFEGLKGSGLLSPAGSSASQPTTSATKGPFKAWSENGSTAGSNGPSNPSTPVGGVPLSGKIGEMATLNPANSIIMHHQMGAGPSPTNGAAALNAALLKQCFGLGNTNNNNMMVTTTPTLLTRELNGGMGGGQPGKAQPSKRNATTSILNRPSHDMAKYKTQICRNLLRTGTCEFGNLCVFAHSKAELRNPMLAAAEAERLTPPETPTDASIPSGIPLRMKQPAPIIIPESPLGAHMNPGLHLLSNGVLAGTPKVDSPIDPQIRKQSLAQEPQVPNNNHTNQHTLNAAMDLLGLLASPAGQQQTPAEALQIQQELLLIIQALASKVQTMESEIEKLRQVIALMSGTGRTPASNGNI